MSLVHLKHARQESDKNYMLLLKDKPFFKYLYYFDQTNIKLIFLIGQLFQDRESTVQMNTRF